MTPTKTKCRMCLRSIYTDAERGDFCDEACRVAFEDSSMYPNTLPLLSHLELLILRSHAEKFTTINEVKRRADYFAHGVPEVTIRRILIRFLSTGLLEEDFENGPTRLTQKGRIVLAITRRFYTW